MSKRDELRRLLAEAKAHLDAYEEYARTLAAAGTDCAALCPAQETDAEEGDAHDI